MTQKNLKHLSGQNVWTEIWTTDFVICSCTRTFDFFYENEIIVIIIIIIIIIDIYFIFFFFSGQLFLSQFFYIHGSVHRESNLITVKKDATYSVYYTEI